MSRPGYTVLQVPVPALETFVRGRFEHYDRAYVSPDPAFTHAHITALAPFLPAPDPAALDTVAAIAAAASPITFTLRRLETFPNGIVYLAPEPADPFRALTEALVAAFPQCPPYGGEFPDVVPHLTLDQLSADVSVASTRDALGGTVPVTCVADRVDLAWYQPERSRLLASFALG
ncbi:2'-5' RNA ligase family protein [Jiangella sp. DSM 45060]|uniref:2'-5' RNA ligase family protein n=1 Tax=Jiangella sp. DSM 45060 TaxID=1798224 RepID=UPI00087B5283|nr:2'-5' RNA ligase family protein [Jiangella sp. DSM 45060]SDT63001.1 2'-5' RNA ligase superfamily protein [Jiangella sp. DSM 45060]